MIHSVILDTERFRWVNTQIKYKNTLYPDGHFGFINAIVKAYPDAGYRGTVHLDEIEHSFVSEITAQCEQVLSLEQQSLIYHNKNIQNAEEFINTLYEYLVSYDFSVVQYKFLTSFNEYIKDIFGTNQVCLSPIKLKNTPKINTYDAYLIPNGVCLNVEFARPVKTCKVCNNFNVYTGLI